jgi:hypothetical protein
MYNKPTRRCDMPRDFGIEQKPDEVLRLMEANLGGNENYEIIGSGWLTYKAGELNSRATKRLTLATYILAITSICQLGVLIYNIMRLAHP